MGFGGRDEERIVLRVLWGIEEGSWMTGLFKRVKEKRETREQTNYMPNNNPKCNPKSWSSNMICPKLHLPILIFFSHIFFEHGIFGVLVK